MAQQTSPFRTKEGLGLWEHRGKVAVVGIGNSPCDRRWDETIETSLGAYAKIAAEQAIEEAGLKVGDIDGVVAGAGSLGGLWADRGEHFFDPPFDTENGISTVTAEWLVKYMGVKDVGFLDSSQGVVGNAVILAAEAVAAGRCNSCLVVRSLNNFAGRYLHAGPLSEATAPGRLQWIMPYGWTGGPSDLSATFQRYLYKYNQSHDKMAAYAVHCRKMGLMSPHGYYYQNRPEPLTVEDYLTARWVIKPFNMYDMDMPVNTVACYLVTSAERAKDLKQPAAYILGHSLNQTPKRGMFGTLEEFEAGGDLCAKILFEASGLSVKDIDVANLYDGFTPFSLNWLESFGYGGVKKGEGLDFYQGDLGPQGPYPYNTSGGNAGTGRGHGIAHFTDSIQQVQGRAGERQVKDANISVSATMPPDIGSAVLFGRHPD